METIEEKNKRETFKRFKQARTLYSFKEIGEKCGLTKQRMQEINFDFHLNPRYNPHSNTLKKLNKGFDELNIPKQDTEVFDGIMQGLKEADNFLKGKKSGCRVHKPKGE